jgi:hypothetical protein
MPSSPATSRASLSSAEAIPACASGVFRITAFVMGTFMMPMPPPATMRQGTSEPKVAFWPFNMSMSSPAVIITMPSDTVRCPPIQPSTFVEAPANTASANAIGRNSRPDFTGENPRTSCRYCEVKK